MTRVMTFVCRNNGSRFNIGHYFHFQHANYLLFLRGAEARPTGLQGEPKES